MTAAQKKAIDQLVVYVMTNYRPNTKDLEVRCQIEQQFLALAYRANPECRYLYEQSLMGVFV